MMVFLRFRTTDFSSSSYLVDTGDDTANSLGCLEECILELRNVLLIDL